jgi:hypothetical protein
VQQATALAQRMLLALQENRRQDFLAAFDAATIRRCAYLFSPVRDQLVQWTREEVCAPQNLRLGKDLVRNSVTQASPGIYRVRWMWPEPRVAAQCLVAVTPRRLALGADPRTTPGVEFCVCIDRKQYAEQGCVIYRHGRGVDFVCVWAVIDLGFTTLLSPPLELGRIRQTERGRIVEGW